MMIAYVVVAVFLAAALSVSALGKVTRMEQVTTSLAKAGVTEQMFTPLAVVQVVGATGLVVGIWVPAIGVAAGAGVTAYFIGAVGFHVRAKDPGFGPPAFLGVLGAAAAVLRALA